MGNAGEMARENEALRQRLSRLSEASLRITSALSLLVRCSLTYTWRHPPGV